MLPFPVDCAVDPQVVLERVEAALPRTEFAGARLLKGPCLVELRLANGNVAYADRSGRYFLIGAMLDLHTGDGTGGTPIGEDDEEESDDHE